MGLYGLLQEQLYLTSTCVQRPEFCWKEVKVLQIKPNTTFKKYKESVHVSLSIGQLSFDIWTPIIIAEVKNLQLCPV
jgi:hypothetical protein